VSGQEVHREELPVAPRLAAERLGHEKSCVGNLVDAGRLRHREAALPLVDLPSHEPAAADVEDTPHIRLRRLDSAGPAQQLHHRLLQEVRDLGGLDLETVPRVVGEPLSLAGVERQGLRNLGAGPRICRSRSFHSLSRL